MIITDEAILRKPCDIVSLEEVSDLKKQLDEELSKISRIRPGVGLAAPQIGISKRMAIVRLVDGINNYKIDLVNAEIKNGYDEFVFRGEGCLSFPGLKVDVVRYNEIYVVNNLVEPHSFIATGALAVVVQHELDHLNGKLLIDYKK